MAEELLETEAIEEPAPDDGSDEGSVRRLPERVSSGDLSLWRDEVKTAALAAGAGIVAGAATVAVVRASNPRRRSGRRGLLRREPPQRILASRSFLIDVHLLGSK